MQVIKMDIALIDKNLKVETNIDKENLVWFDVRKAPFKVYGLYNYKNEPIFKRMPTDVAEATNEGVAALYKNTAGGRVRFKTNSPYIAIKAVMPSKCHMPHMAMTGSAGFDLYRVKDGIYSYVKSFVPPANTKPDYESVVEGWDVGAEREYEINFPLYSSVDALYIGLDKNSILESAKEYRDIKPVVYYGSSITQGGCASRPGLSYQSVISRRFDLDYINLGFSGSARGEDAVVDYMAGLDMSIFVSDYDHNAPNAKHLAATHFKLYEKIRAKNPELPILFVSRPGFDTGFDAQHMRIDYLHETIERRNVVYETYCKAFKQGDKNVFFIDGESLFEGEDRGDCTVDGTHPNDLGFYRMANRIGSMIERILF